MSSPRYSQANGAAERAVRTIKQMLKKAEDPYLALLAYRTTPLHNGFSPSELLFGRKLKDTVPTNPDKLKPKWPNMVKVTSKEIALKQKQTKYYNKRHRVQNLPQLCEGDNVWIKDKRTWGKVISEDKNPRSFHVETNNGILLRRNARFLRSLPGSSIIQQSASRQTTQDCLHTPVSNNHSGNSEQEVNHQSNHTVQGDSSEHYVTRSGRVSKPPDRLNL